LSKSIYFQRAPKASDGRTAVRIMNPSRNGGAGLGLFLERAEGLWRVVELDAAIMLSFDWLVAMQAGVSRIPQGLAA
jgi:hypothetical protein